MSINVFVEILLLNSSLIIPRIQTVCRPLSKWFYFRRPLCWQHYPQVIRQFRN